MPTFRNFSYSTVATAPSPAASGTSLAVQAGHGARFPDVPFRAVVWPPLNIPTQDNAEIVDVTAVVVDTLTLVRAREGSSARAVAVGDQIAAVLTRDVLQTIRNSQVRINRFTPPVNADFAWVNQGTSSIRDDTDSVVLIGGAAGAGANIAVRVKTAPTPPYTITTYMEAIQVTKPLIGYGVCFRESGTGEIHAFHVIGDGSTPSQNRLMSSQWASATGGVVHYQTLYTEWPVRWFRIADDGVNRICSISRDGIDWLQIHSVARTDFLTANQVGFQVSVENSATPNLAPIVRLLHWLEG